MEGETIEALARKIGVDADQLAQTVERYNGFAETGDRRRLRPRLQRTEPVQWRSHGQAQSLSAADRSWTVLCSGRVAVRPCQQCRLAHGFIRPGLVSRRKDPVRPLRGRHRFILDLPRHLPGTGHDDRPGDRVRLVRRDGCCRNAAQVPRSAAALKRTAAEIPPAATLTKNLVTARRHHHRILQLDEATLRMLHRGLDRDHQAGLKR